MHLLSEHRRFSVITFVLAGMVVLVGAISAKPIRLRNALIETPQKSMVGALTGSAQKISGLHLIQLEGSLQPEWRIQLAEVGVELLGYVPEDAFIARLDGADATRVRKLPFVRWVSHYEPAQKIHGDLAKKLAKGTSLTTEMVGVAVLVTPAATKKETAILRATFSKLTSESILSSGTIWRGVVRPDQLAVIAASEAVMWMESAPKMRISDEIATKIVAGDGGSPGTLAAVHQLGFTGAGVTVAVADSGLDSGDTNSMHPDISGRVKALFQYGAVDDASDEHSHGTHCAGIIAGNAATGEVDANGYLYGLGVAPGAGLIAQRIFDGDGNYTLTNSFFDLVRDAKRAGADIGSNSWGDESQGRYDLSAMEFDALVRDADTNTPGDQPYILEFSAGNSGPGEQTINSPAVAKNVIATGASENDRPDLLLYADGPDAMADFSSRGPCEDGRIKPDLVAPGTWIASLRSVYANDDNAWAGISDNYMYQGGTSQAGPHVSGAAAVFVQYWRQGHTNATPSPALVKAALINSAYDLDETLVYSPFVGDDGDVIFSPAADSPLNPVPNSDEGWGRVSLPDLIGATNRSYDFVDQSTLLATGQQYERRVLIGSADEPLKVTLTYTDVPGSPAAIPALVNDLDLEIIAPNGHVYHGNQFDAGESIPDTTAYDSINNVEGVHISAPTPGEYIIRVRARNVPMDARRDTAAVDQDFALVVSGHFAAPGTGIISFDRRVYTAPIGMKLRLVDYDLAGQATASLVLRSGAETNGETVMLHADGPNGSFTSTVFTATGPAQADGKLQIQHGNTIEAVYLDGATQRIYTAHADLLPPLISGLVVTNRFGQAHILWSTDEPASGRVLYGTNSALGSELFQAALVTNHFATPGSQSSGETNFFIVVCTDEAGNSVTNNNGGSLFNFVVPYTPGILLVDDFFGDLLFTPPLENWTTPLNQLGLTYDVWNVQSLGPPGTNDLRSYRVVLWRVSEANPNRPTGLTTAEQVAIRTYVSGGGSLFMASMELMSRLGSGSAFLHDILHVQTYNEDVTVSGAEGAPADPIGDGLSLETTYDDYLGFDASDTLTPGDGAEGFLYDTTSGDYCALRYPASGSDSAGRVVFMSFPFDAVPLDPPAPDNRTTLLRRVLLFLAPGLNGEGSVTFDRSAYTVPGQATVQVADSDLSGLGQISIKVSSNTQTNGLNLLLSETLRRGVFQGALSLVASNAAAKLRVTPGDTVRADYFDASLNFLLSAYAPVETNPPVITSVTNEPGYVDATIFWDTDEASDSLVEYGESPLLGRSAYRRNATTSHAVGLSQLLAEHTYYYRVTSRDNAGNLAIDDNDGALYTFTTLTPLHPPWADSGDQGVTNWTVYTTEESQRGWELGAPGAFSPAAHSPANAWGSNLKGDYADTIETYLISPAILLSGGNRATLSFWHAYDFTTPSELDILHGGELLLITNAALAPIPLASYGGDTIDWEQVQVDLTPYTNQIVYLAWHYVLFSLDSLPREGWLVDDVSVTISNAATGTIVVSNNLWQANFVVSGPVTNSGRGVNATFANVPAGQYSVQFTPVSFYQTPSPQSNTLSSGGTLTFSGNYTFADTNANGMPDAWEKFYFGSANRTTSSDADGDGVGDLGEFQAGTNPTNATSRLRLAASYQPSSNSLHLQWPSAPDHAYRLLSSSNLLTWQAYSGWLQPATTNSVFDSPATNSALRFLRLETRP